MAQLSIKAPSNTAYDAIALGEIMLRLDPGSIPTAKSRSCLIWHGGGEINVAEGLSYAFGMRCACITAALPFLPKSQL